MVRTGSKKGGLFMTYFVGIDIAKHLHYACIINQSGQVVTQPFPFENTSVGFQLLLSPRIVFLLDSNLQLTIMKT